MRIGKLDFSLAVNRTFKSTMRYWKPTRLTLDHNPKVCAFLWWNYSFELKKGLK